MKRKEIIAALAPLYRTARGENRAISAEYVATENDHKSKSISRRLSKSHGFVEGLEAAARALGVNLLEIV